MQRTIFALMVLAFVGLGIAFAQDIEVPPIPDLDLEGWATDSARLAIPIFFLVAVVRKWIYRFEGWQVPVFSIAVGAVLGVILALTTPYIPDGLLSGLIHGVSAGFIAFGGVDAIRSAIGTSKPDVAVVIEDPESVQRVKASLLRP